MSEKFLETKDDLQWLEDVHVPGATSYECAVIVGNEDWPDEIRLYRRNHVDCKPAIYRLNEEGNSYLVELGEAPA